MIFGIRKKPKEQIAIEYVSQTFFLKYEDILVQLGQVES